MPRAPIAAGGRGVGHLADGDVAEMAGYGLTEGRTVGSLRLLAEAITTIDATTITVRASARAVAVMATRAGRS